MGAKNHESVKPGTTQSDEDDVIDGVHQSLQVPPTAVKMALATMALIYFE